MNNINNEDSASPSIVEDGWNDRATMGNRHELRFLKKESDSTNTKTKTKTDKESTDADGDGKKGKTKSSTSTTELVSPTPPSATTVTPVPAPDEPEIAQLVAQIAQLVAPGTEDETDDLLS